MSFANLKRGGTDLSKLINDAEKSTGARDRSTDERFWTPTRDKAGNGYAIIRFLPGPGKKIPFLGFVIGTTPSKVQLVNGTWRSR